MSNKFEKSLWSVRYITILPVLLSIISSVALLVLGGWEIIEAIIFYNPLFDDSITSSNELLFKIISAIDLFLIGIVLNSSRFILLIAWNDLKEMSNYLYNRNGNCSLALFLKILTRWSYYLAL